jgi:DNA polymerase-4
VALLDGLGELDAQTEDVYQKVTLARGMELFKSRNFTGALELFEKLYTRRVLIRLIGIRFSDLVTGSYQIKLFDDSEKMVDLYHAMDNIRKRFGDRAVLRAAGMDAKTIGRFNPFSGEPPPLLANRRI